jgi:hypothetical protein
MIETALFHHRVDTATSEYGDLIKATYIADAVVNHIQTNLDSGDFDLNALSLEEIPGSVLGKIGARIAREFETHNEFMENLI